MLFPLIFWGILILLFYFYSFIYICWDEKAVVKMVLKISLPYPITEHSCTYICAVKPRIVIVSLSYGKWTEIKAQQWESRLSSWLMFHLHLHGRLIRIKNRSNGLIGLGTCMLPACTIVKEQIQLPLKAMKSFLLKGKKLEEAQRKSFNNSVTTVRAYWESNMPVL